MILWNSHGAVEKTAPQLVRAITEGLRAKTSGVRHRVPDWLPIPHQRTTISRRRFNISVLNSSFSVG